MIVKPQGVVLDLLYGLLLEHLVDFLLEGEELLRIAHIRREVYGDCRQWRLVVKRDLIPQPDHLENPGFDLVSFPRPPEERQPGSYLTVLKATHFIAGRWKVQAAISYLGLFLGKTYLSY